MAVVYWSGKLTSYRRDMSLMPAASDNNLFQHILCNTILNVRKARLFLTRMRLLNGPAYYIVN